ncbi:hypothetical protein B9Z19DRAFT_730458 [Tuber borchii]|uniref:Uncharacterized protein n=1 Tax=Tuber borchii TaxID=42251 RepID=A0A2T6ZY75_TUBBO|nr:hypothetical protein B9Z19DRAFT_730458 [Tuber borchii]
MLVCSEVHCLAHTIPVHLDSIVCTATNLRVNGNAAHLTHTIPHNKPTILLLHPTTSYIRRMVHPLPPLPSPANLVGESSSAESLRQTFNVAVAAAGTATATSPNSNSSRSTSRTHSRRKPPPSISTVNTISGLLTPAGSVDNSGTESPDEEVHDHEEGMRHGFAEEYNSEAYLAVLEQLGFLHVLYR